LGAENQEVYLTFSPLFERIWLETKKRLPDYVAINRQMSDSEVSINRKTDTSIEFESLERSKYRLVKNVGGFCDQDSSVTGRVNLFFQSSGVMDELMRS
jgi:hypothetical protein